MAKELQLPRTCVIITGAIFENHPHASLMRTLLMLIEQYSGAKRLHFTSGANAAGAWLAGMLPHRTLAGKAVAEPGWPRAKP